MVVDLRTIPVVKGAEGEEEEGGEGEGEGTECTGT